MIRVCRSVEGVRIVQAHSSQGEIVPENQTDEWPHWEIQYMVEQTRSFEDVHIVHTGKEYREVMEPELVQMVNTGKSSEQALDLEAGKR